MNPASMSRRLFLRQSSGVAGAAWLKAVVPSMAAIAQAACTAKEEQQPFTILEAAVAQGDRGWKNKAQRLLDEVKSSAAKRQSE